MGTRGLCFMRMGDATSSFCCYCECKPCRGLAQATYVPCFPIRSHTSACFPSTSGTLQRNKQAEMQPALQRLQGVTASTRSA
eukprot:1160204-Pelagomonas_calceolata.AAC.2